MQINKIASPVVYGIATLILVACGGGGGSSTPAPTPGPASSSTLPGNPVGSDGIAGNFSGPFTADIEIRDRTGGGDITTASSLSSAAQFSIAPGGALTGTGFGCSFSGTLTLSDVALQLHTGSVNATGCTDATLNGLYQAKAHPENAGALEFEMERETEVANMRTKVNIRSRVGTSTSSTLPGNSTGPAGIAGNFSGPFTAGIEIRDRTGGGDITTASSLSSAAQFSIAPGGALTGTGFGCSFSGTLTLSDAALQLHMGSVNATGCTDATLNGSYHAEAHPENAGALEFEMEHETEVANVRTKVNIRGRAPRG